MIASSAIVSSGPKLQVWTDRQQRRELIVHGKTKTLIDYLVVYRSGNALQAEPGSEQPLDHMIMQIARNPIAIFQDTEPLLISSRLAQLKAMAAWPAKVAAMSRSASANGGCGKIRPATIAPRGPESPQSGSAITWLTGTYGRTCR
jgi:hypothetical protein